MMIELTGDVRAYFRERLLVALRERRVEVDESTEFYLVNLLAELGMGARDVLGSTLAEKFLGAAQQPGGAAKLRSLRDLGDSALVLLGLFAEHCEKRGVSETYVKSLGERAYIEASDVAKVEGRETALAPVYGELGQGFGEFVLVLADVREETHLRTPQDIVRLYDRWKATGSSKLAAALEREGVFPAAAIKDRVH